MSRYENWQGRRSRIRNNEMAYEHTTVPVSRSQEAIRRLILANGGTGVAFISQPPIEGFEAQIVIDSTPYRIRISAECKVPHGKRNRTGRDDPRQREEKRIWRVLLAHMKSIYEASNTGVMEFRQMILAYIVTKDGQTVGEHILPQLTVAVNSRPERMLPGVSTIK
jgi:hypothetical protein